MSQAPGADGASPGEVYEARLTERRRQVEHLTRRHLQVSNSRLAAFAVAATCAWLSFGSGIMPAYWILAPAAVFLVLVQIHNRILEARGRVRRAVHFYESGLRRLAHRWMGAGRTGARFVHDDHPYAGELDLFGSGALFELLSRARTAAGEATLAGWLQAGAAPAEIRARQEAVRELRPRLSLREEMALLGEDIRAGVEPEILVGWSTAASRLTSRRARLLGRVLTVVVLLTLAAWPIAGLPPGYFLLSLLAQSLFVAVHRRRVNQVVEGMQRPGRELTLFAHILGRLEQERFSSPLLKELRNSLDTSGRPPSRQVATLGWLMEALDWRRNMFFAPLAALLCWNTHIAFVVEQWRAEVGPSIPGWLDAVGRFEALCSLASHAFENPSDPFPEIVEDDSCFAGRGLGHPLIAREKAVPNDVSLDGDLHLLVVSGSNMSGKTTLLRTVGVNTVLALAGATVRAHSLRLSPLRLSASIRLQDSIQAGHSRFYAEILRIRQMVELTSQGPVLFLLDEILHGTNSHDRRIGAEAMVRSLLQRGALGLVTTHDLALASVAEALAPRAANVHFQDHLEDGRMIFDYRMRPGVVEKSNALELMRAIGLDV